MKFFEQWVLKKVLRTVQVTRHDATVAAGCLLNTTLDAFAAKLPRFFTREAGCASSHIQETSLMYTLVCTRACITGCSAVHPRWQRRQQAQNFTME
jgi:hypothetical protein